jgi:hypothetical protein
MSRIRCLNRSSDFGAIVRLMSGPAVKLNPRNFRSLRSARLTALPVAAATQSRSPGVSSVAFHARSPGLRFAPLMDMDFAVSGPLVQRSRLVPGSCPSTRMFALRFLQTSPHGDSSCVVANPSPPSGWVEDFHLQATEHVQHTTKSLRDSPLRGGLRQAQ